MKLTHALAVIGLFAAPMISNAGPAPREISLFVTAEKSDRLDARLFPLGWSKDGKFAWLVRDVDEASDEGPWSLHILDAAAGRELEPVEYSVPDDSKDHGIAKFWAAKESAVLAELKKHGIQQDKPALDHLPVLVGRRRGNMIRVELTETRGECAIILNGVLGYKLTTQAESDEKPATLLESKVEPGANVFAVALAGWFRSPDEKFAAVVVTSVSRGYEGAPHVRGIAAVGGFKLPGEE